MTRSPLHVQMSLLFSHARRQYVRGLLVVTGLLVVSHSSYGHFVNLPTEQTVTQPILKAMAPSNSR